MKYILFALVALGAYSANANSPVYQDAPYVAQLKPKLKTAYCEISNSVNYMYNYMDREDGGLFKYRAHIFSERAKSAIEEAEQWASNLPDYDYASPRFELAKTKIVQAHSEIKDLTLYDPNRGRIKNQLVNPAKAAIREMNSYFELDMDLDSCDTQYPDH